MPRLENLLGAQALAIADRISAAARASGGPSDAAALVTLAAHPGNGVGWLAGILGLTDSGSTRLVERLVVAGLVERQPGSDARSRTLRLTDEGARRAQRLLNDRAADLAGCLADLTPPERQTLERLLAKIVSGLADDRPTALRVCRLCDRDSCAGGPQPCPLGHTTPAVTSGTASTAEGQA